MTKHTKKLPSPQPVNSFSMEFVSVLTITVVILCFGIYRVIYKDLINEQKKTTAQIDTKSATESINWNKVPGQFALFFADSFINRSQTHVYIPVRFSTKLETAWLIMVNVRGQNVLTHFLISHPQLVNLSWKRVNAGPIYLYQRIPTYSSIEEFLNNPPPANKVLIDSELHLLMPYKNIKATILSDTTSIDSYDYILTTYNQSKIEQNTVYYENIIDASSAIPNEKNRHAWQVFVDNASESNPYYIGEPHIGYSQ